MSLRFSNVARPTSAAQLGDAGRAQVVAYGTIHDGEVASAEERFGGAHKLYQPEQLRVLDDDGRALFDVWLSGDSGVVFRAGTTALVGCVVQFGYTGTDLAIWEALAVAARDGVDRESALHLMDFTLSDDAGPLLWVVKPPLDGAIAAAPDRAHELFGDPTVEIASGWRALRVVVQPWDREGVLTRVLTASNPLVLPDVDLHRVPPAWFAPPEMGAIAATLKALPRDAVAQRAGALAAAIDEPDYREPRWLQRLLDALRASAADAVATGSGFLVATA